MNTPLRGATWALLALCPLAYLACGDSSSGGSATTDIDAATATPTGDAATTTTDAGDAATDASADADADAAPPTLVTVTAITSSKLPEANANVVFYDNAGAVLGTTLTDAMGKATREMPAGGQVTVVFGTTTRPNLVSIQGVQGGDNLTALDPARIGTTRFVVTPPAAAFPNATSLSVHIGSCVVSTPVAGGNSSSISPARCTPFDVATVVLVAQAANGTALATSALQNVQLVSGTTTVAFTNAWTAVGANVTSRATNVPAMGAVSQVPNTNTFALTQGLGTNDMISTSNGNAPLASSSPTSSSVFAPFYPAPAFLQNEADVFEETNDFSALVTRAVVTRSTAAANPSIDFSTALPAISSTTVTGTTVPTVTWVSNSPLTATKGIVAYSSWFQKSQSGSWLVLAPPSATTITPPALPTALTAYGPSGNYQSPVLVAAVDATFLPDYATTRASAALLTPQLNLVQGNFAAVVPPLPVDGTLKLTAFGANSD